MTHEEVILPWPGSNMLKIRLILYPNELEVLTDDPPDSRSNAL